ncbi:MAG: hypothetical protein ACPG6F_01285 [Flavobacteriaceae bacterium]
MKKLIYSLIAFGMLLPVQGQNLKTIKKTLQNSIDEKKEALTQISDAIWEAAETSLEEYESSQILKDYARAQGFEVTENVAGISTAFMAKYGTGKPVIGILGQCGNFSKTKADQRGAHPRCCRAWLWAQFIWNSQFSRSSGY